MEKRKESHLPFLIDMLQECWYERAGAECNAREEVKAGEGRRLCIYVSPRSVRFFVCLQSFEDCALHEKHLYFV